ncbi:MAG: hypothetical protein NT009_10275 [Proteobacteria bacterium]|nr:hypothetical protein [Pseudomonadota bacterium]
MVKRTILMIARITLAGILIILGVVGLIAPIMPGWIFIVPGVGLLYREIAFVSRAIKRRIGIMFRRVQSNEP